MKKIKIIIAVAFTIVGGAALNAQTIYDAARVMGNDLNGTARFVGMGGAMGALGGDISTMGTNPAGIGLFRSSDVMVSFGFANSGMKSTYGDRSDKLDKFFGSFDNAGAVFAYKMGNQTPLRFVNFGFNYRKLKSFDRNRMIGGTYNASQTEQMADMLNATNLPPTAWDKNSYGDERLPWLGVLGYNSYLANPWYDKDSGDFGGYDPYFQKDNEVDGIYNSRERGALNAFDFNIAFNFYDRVYVGATLGAYYMDYSRNSTYQEDFWYKNNEGEWVSEGGYALNNHYKVTGSGFDFKLGLVVRPFEFSPLRIGAAIHTPIFYKLTGYGSASIDYDVDGTDADGNSLKPGYTYTQNAYGDDLQSETPYGIVTPWKYNLSLGYTIGKSVALGAEYEYADYSTTKFKFDDGVEMIDETKDAKNMLKGVHTLRVGAEFKLAPEFAFRLGYNHITAAMKDDAFKFLPSDGILSVRTDTEYSNLKAANNYTLGFGYRGSSFYADMAYQLNTYKEEFFAFDNKFLDATHVTNMNHRVVFTLGLRF